jgi:hypothetical protein
MIYSFPFPPKLAKVQGKEILDEFFIISSLFLLFGFGRSKVMGPGPDDTSSGMS